MKHDMEAFNAYLTLEDALIWIWQNDEQNIAATRIIYGAMRRLFPELPIRIAESLAGIIPEEYVYVD